MKSYETSATVEDRGRLLLDGLPFAAGTEVEVVISPKAVDPASARTDAGAQSIEAARARMRDLFASVQGFRMAPKIRREDLYDRYGLR
jgi:hypothetical protein